MKKVAHLLINLDHGGAEHLVARWTRIRHQKGLEAGHGRTTCVYTLDHPGALSDTLPPDLQFCAHMNRARFPFDLAGLRRLRTQLRKDQIEVVHSHNLAAQQYATLATMGSPIAHVNTQHGRNEHLGGTVNRLRSRLLGLAGTRLVAVSDDTKAHIVTSQRQKAANIQVIPNGIEPFDAEEAQTDSSVPSSDSLPPSSAFVFGSIGRLVPVKGWARFVPVFADFSRQLPAPESGGPALLLVGDGPEREALEALAAELKISHRVWFAGFQNQPRWWLRRMQVFLLPSLSEGLSVALLEAIEAGCYPIVTNVGDSALALERAQTGQILTESVHSWEAALRQVFTEAPPRQPGRLFQSPDCACYAQSACLAAYEALYTEAANDATGR